MALILVRWARPKKQQKRLLYLSNKGGKKRCILYWKVDSSNGTCSDARSINPNCIKTFSLMQRARFLEVTLGSLHTGLICKGLFTSKSWLYLSTIYLSLLELDFMNGRGYQCAWMWRVVFHLVCMNCWLRFISHLILWVFTYRVLLS